MVDDMEMNEGDLAVLVQLGPCVGGMVQTWLDDGSSCLWSTPDAELLLGMQGKGLIGRSLREEHRFRETGLLVESSGALLVQSRFPVATDDGSVTIEAQQVRLEAGGEPSETVLADFRTLLTQAIHHCVESNEFLVVERGGWDAPNVPYCLFVVVDEGDGPVSVIETAPAPRGSEIWDPHIAPGSEGSTLRAPTNTETLGVAPLVMIEAISRWRLAPWDLALTFGQR